MNVAILIVTRNRPSNLRSLLASISYSKERPRQVIVVSSGDLIDDEIDKFRSELNIDHKHVEKKGQIYQKMVGISMLNSEIRWVLNLDDDLILPETSLGEAIDVLRGHLDQSLVGLGFKLLPSLKIQNGFLARCMKTLFGLNGAPGKVLRNGHATSYMNSQSPIVTDWLIGASLWKREALQLYSGNFLDAKYAAYEDVIFSYSVGKLGKLLYNPNCELFFQDEQPNDVSNFSAFNSASYWRYYFVRINPELSSTLLLWAQLARNIEFIYSNWNWSPSFIGVVWKISLVYLDLLQASVRKIDPLKFISNRLGPEKSKKLS